MAKPPTKATKKAAAVSRAAKQINTFSQVPDLPRPAAAIPRTPAAMTGAESYRAGKMRSRRIGFEQSPQGQERLRDPLSQLTSTGVPAASALRTVRDMHLGMGTSEREDTTAAATGMHPLRGREVPDINAPHPITATVVPQRRWEDLHPQERAATLKAAKSHGVTEESATRDYSTQITQAHTRALSSGHPRPYSQNFYAGPSAPRARIVQSGQENAQHPAFPPGVDPHVVQSVANSITSPRNKFEVENVKTGEKTYPNDEHATHAIQHALNAGPGADSEAVAQSVPNASGPSGGGMMGNIKRAAFASHQLLFRGATMKTLHNPITDMQAEKGQEAGAKTFGTPSTQKTSAYVGAWTHPEDPDSFLTTDVHTGHGFAAHLTTAKQPTGKFKDGKKVLGSSEVEKYIEKTPHVHAFHDYVARKVHAELGLSLGVSNAQHVNRGQASQWGEERIQRPDITDATQARIYPTTHAQQLMARPRSIDGIPVEPMSHIDHFHLGAGIKSSSATPELRTGRERDKDEAAARAIQSAVRTKRRKAGVRHPLDTGAEIDPADPMKGWT